MPDRWSIDDGWYDVRGSWHDAPQATASKIRAAMGDPSVGRPVWVVPRGWTETLEGPCRLLLDDGTDLGVSDSLPGDLPIGRHVLRPADDGPETHLLVTPGRCRLPAGLRASVLAAQLYAARSRRSWGIGDLADLRRLGEWAGSHGVDYLVTSPLHAPLPETDPQPSPYYPSSRLFLNPLHLAVDELPGAADDAGVAEQAASGRALLSDRHIDRARVWAAKAAALETLWERGVDREALGHFRRERGESLERFATFCALWELHQRPWWEWPAEVRHPGGSGVDAFRRDRPDRIAYHCWLQLHAADQLAAAGRALPLIADLAIGVDPGGADAWMHQELMAPEFRIGAPPDEFNPDGQDWGLPPFIPHRLRDAGYAPFAEALAASMVAGGGLRIDHVMGLFRLFWVPPEEGPGSGAYVRYRADEMLAVVAIESHRAGCLVVGEDLGTVEEGVRERLEAANVLGMRLLWFEDQPPQSWPGGVLGAATSHDLPTIAGAWTGADARARADAGLSTEAEETLRDKLLPLVGPDAETAEVVQAVHRALAASPVALATGTLDDTLVVEERPNMPGTTDAWPNWSIALPTLIDDLPTETAPATLLADRP